MARRKRARCKKGDGARGPLRECTIPTAYGGPCLTDHKPKRAGTIAYRTQVKPCVPNIKCVPTAGVKGPRGRMRLPRRRLKF